VFVSKWHIRMCHLLTNTPAGGRCIVSAVDGDMLQHLSICNVTCAAADRRYISLVKGGNFLRALRRCVSPTGDRTLYILNFVACPEGTTLEAILGYVR